MRQNKSLFPREIVYEALKQSFVKLRPGIMVRNPVMFTVYIVTIIMFFVCIWIMGGEHSQGSLTYNVVIFAVLFITVLFANFAEAIAEARGKAQANSLRKTREDTNAKLVVGDTRGFDVKITSTLSSKLKRGDVFLCEAGDI